MEVDQILSDSWNYTKSSWGKVAMLGAIVLITMIIIIGGAFVAGFALGFNNWIVAILVGLLVGVICLLTYILYSGYLFRVVKASLAGINELPGFDEFMEMFIDGAKVFLVQLVYGIVYAIIAAIVIGIVVLVGSLTMAVSYSSMFSYYSDPSSILSYYLASTIFNLVIYIAMLVMIAITVLVSLVLPLSIANMALKDSIGAAFDISAIQERLNNIRWIKALTWILAIWFISIIASLVTSILQSLLIGFIIGPLIITPFLSIFYYRSSALLFEEGE